MSDSIKNDVRIVENSEEFKVFKQEHPKSYLAHVFAMKKVSSFEEQIGYFDPVTEKITTFSLEPVRVVGSDEALSKNGVVKELPVSEVDVSLTQARAIGAQVVKEHYNDQTVTQEICILQTLEQTLWNITLVTSSFNMVNVRVNASSGVVESHKQSSLMSLGKPA